MDLVIQQSCPSCGAPIVLNETDRLIGCPYCGVKNYMIGGGTCRFSLPDKVPDHIAREDLIYVPYLRFKGSIYYCQGHEVQHAVIDTTRLAIDGLRLPGSLGLRPQAMKIVPVNAEHLGRFVRQTIDPETVFAQAIKLTALFAPEKKQQLHHRAFIGETLSRIYLPLYVKDDMLIDGVTHLEVGRLNSSISFSLENSTVFQTSWEPRFLSTLCPHCAAPMTGEADALVLHCLNCQRMWGERDGCFVPIDWQNIDGGGEACLAIPFWRITLGKESSDELRSFADFLRLTNQPVVVRKDDENLALSFWIPAFKLTPSLFLQTAHYLTVSQRRIPAGEPNITGRSYPVNLPQQEAVQALKSVLAESSLSKKRVLPLLASLKLSPQKITLAYLPFRDSGHDFIQRHTLVTLNSAALRFGRKL